MHFSSDDVKAVAPTGVLRATINLGNPILARQDTGQPPSGVSVDLAQALAAQLGLPLELLVVDAAGKAVEAVSSSRADVGFFAIDPLRANGILFTAPYVLIEGCYLVRETAHYQTHDDVDHPNVRIVVGRGSAYDLYLTRELQKAKVVHTPTSPSVVDVFLNGKYEVAAGVKQQLEADACRAGGLRLLPEPFMIIQQAMGLPKARGEAAVAVLHRFVEDMKASSFVTNALERHGIQGASVAHLQA